RSYDGDTTLLSSVSPNQLTYTDSIQEIIFGEGNFCYYIEAIEGFGAAVNGVQFQEISLSNEACALQHPNVFVPNAFMLEGVNNVFKPVTVYVEVSSYLFQIYNHWGQRIFESRDPEIGWDGTMNGKRVKQGTYAYFISFVSSNGDTQTKNGTVTLIR
ncbi:MAG: gliding motility-associated C-terminal domain-containing protein, partial [Flavobacteriales bacterium]|nr:gliding motility-associated C-terminal domain-containing protein [Flavobacteriales bacterium]